MCGVDSHLYKTCHELRVAPGLANCSCKKTTKTETRAPYCKYAGAGGKLGGGGGVRGEDLADQWLQPK